jgi:hypothetical protein
MTQPPICNGVQDWMIGSWREFYDLVMSKFSDSPAYIFRGQADVSWKISSALDRLEEKYPKRKNFGGSVPKEFDCPVAARDTHLLAFRQAIRGRPGIPVPPDDDDECWALAQHHGLKTPMLDWTLSPFVALFFAFEDVGDSKERMVAALSSSVIDEKSSTTDPPPKPNLPRNEASHRLLVQSGLFLRMPKTDLETYVRSHFAEESTKDNSHARAVLVKIRIPDDDRVGCLKALNKMNINRMTLFPDIDGAARYVNALWEIDFDTSLGHIGRGDITGR